MIQDDDEKEEEPSQHLYDRFKLKNLQQVFFIKEVSGSQSKMHVSNNDRSNISGVNTNMVKGEDYNLSTLEENMDDHKHHFLKYYNKVPKKPKFGSFLRSAMYEEHFGFTNFGQVLVYLTKLFSYFDNEFFDKEFLLAVDPRLGEIIKFERDKRERISKNQNMSKMQSRK